ncbi:uncharacterized protein [Physcomitrium patens]|uniref:Histone deacetylase complex subunit SAP30 Sin3 binding domain-containing protein n=1 Tax=Physcomitrium patens TaxID=3218 RepID=A0A2K1K2A8_PHYPA|nr:uncharacterized protein LOC112286984 isoform X2 [Physcomitrium patens]PNR47911.1 hypothetical protein PHYPA_012384 [Physcomitrium patens]|eukprot:XP_024385285.1 uncharacterized protein LOC112286984 isoform X2 [Physcomitrella patens]
MGFTEESFHSHSHSGEDSGDELLSALPRHTKVVVTGNNRTKSVLVGLHGVVTKAVGLGGWHWLVLTNGDEVKLQRNALSVIEGPSGLEEVEDNEDYSFPSRTSQENNIRRNSFRVQPRKLVCPVSSNPGMAGQVGKTTQCGYANDRRGGFVERRSSSSRCLPSVNFSKLEIAALKRYLRHFKLVEGGPNSSREQLVDAVCRHFMSQELDEGKVIMGFMRAAKRLRI